MKLFMVILAYAAGAIATLSSGWGWAAVPLIFICGVWSSRE